MKQYPKWIGTLLFVFLIAAAGALAAETAKSPPSASTDKILDPGDIVKDSDKYLGHTVTVRGTVDRLIAEGVFTLKENKATAFSNLLVIAPKSKRTSAELAEGSTLTITGEVSEFSKADLETKYGIAGVNADLVSDFDKKPVLVVSSMK